MLNILSGDDELGPWITSHRGIQKISFTGSTATGIRVLESAAASLKRVTLELGGNDAAVVLPDVDVDEVVPDLFWSAFRNSGQICMATKRLYVHNDIYDRFRDALLAYAKTVVMGDGALPGVQLGPIQNEPQYRRLLDMLEDCRSNGLRMATVDAPLPSTGYFIPVTFVDDPPETSRVVIEEAFGPVLPLLRFTDVEDVVRRVNDSAYGLTASVWSHDIEAARTIADRLECGTVWINEAQRVTPDTPLAGHKQSGLGVENGIDGLLEYTAIQIISARMSPGEQRPVPVG